jgi:hypothetical protein
MFIIVTHNHYATFIGPPDQNIECLLQPNFLMLVTKKKKCSGVVSHNIGKHEQNK